MDEQRKWYNEAAESVEIDLQKLGKHLLGDTKGVALLSRQSVRHAGRTEVWLDYNCCKSFPIDANELTGHETVGDILTTRTKNAMKEMAREIYADIKPWLEPEKPVQTWADACLEKRNEMRAGFGSPPLEPAKLEVWSFLCHPAIELNP